MEKMFPHCGKLACGALLIGGLAAGAGCRSVAANRLAVPKAAQWLATASAAEPDHGPELALDGDTNTWWRSGSEEPQWIQVDMGRAAMVCGFSVQWGTPHATAYAVLTSRDGTHWALGYETTGGDGDWDQMSIEPILARHLRVVVNKGQQGTGAALCALEIKGLADRPQIRVDGVPDPGTAALLDGNPATVWRSERSAAVVELDLRSAKPVGSVRVDWGTHGFASEVAVEISTNGLDWRPAGRIRARAGDFDVAMNEEVGLAQQVRLSFSGGPAEGFEVAGLALRGTEGAARPWALYELAAAHGEAFKKAIHEFTVKLHKDDPELDLRLFGLRVVQEAWKWSEDKSPAVVVFFGSIFSARIEMTGRTAKEKALLDAVESAIEVVRPEAQRQIKTRMFYPYISDSSFMAVCDDTLAIQALETNMPQYGVKYTHPVDKIRQIDVPVVNIGTFGRDGHMLTERVDMRQTFQNVPNITYETVKRLLS